MITADPRVPKLTTPSEENGGRCFPLPHLCTWPAFAAVSCLFDVPAKWNDNPSFYATSLVVSSCACSESRSSCVMGMPSKRLPSCCPPAALSSSKRRLTAFDAAQMRCVEEGGFAGSRAKCTLHHGQRSFASWPCRPNSAFHHQGVPLLAEVEVLWLPWAEGEPSGAGAGAEVPRPTCAGKPRAAAPGSPAAELQGLCECTWENRRGRENRRRRRSCRCRRPNCQWRPRRRRRSRCQCWCRRQVGGASGGRGARKAVTASDTAIQGSSSPVLTWSAVSASA